MTELRHSKRWTIDEITFLRDNLKGLPVREIAQTLGRSEGAVRVKMHKLGLKLLESRELRRLPDYIGTMPDTTAAYLAGLWDADGWFQFGRRKMMSIKMTHRPTIAWVAKIVGGKVMHIKAKHERHKDSYQTNVWVCNQKALCKRMLPFMITKREQALRVLKRE